MWINMVKSILVTFIISIGAMLLSYLVSPLIKGDIGLAIVADVLIFCLSLASYVLLANLWLFKQRITLLNVLSVAIVPLLAGSPMNTTSYPPYGPTLTLYNGYLAPIEDIAHHFHTSSLNNHYMLVLEVLAPPFLMWSGLTLQKLQNKTLKYSSL